MNKLSFVLATAVVASVAFLAACSDEGGLTDSRDGRHYRTVRIGDQVWMAENLNYKMDSSWCYNDSAKYCDKYGRLYTGVAAMNACPEGYKLPSKEDFRQLIAATGDTNAAYNLKSKEGWRIYEDMYYRLETGNVREVDGNGADSFAFSVLPAGCRDMRDRNFAERIRRAAQIAYDELDNEDGPKKVYPEIPYVWETAYENVGQEAKIWTSSFNGEKQLHVSFNNEYANVDFTETYRPEDAFSIRCLKK